MKCSLVVLLAVLCAVMLSDTEAWRIHVYRPIRGRGILRRIFKPICHVVCRRVCTAGMCAPVCRKLCGWRRRKAPGEKILLPMTKPFPSEFEQYDSDEDGFISVQELAALLELEPSQAGIKEAFSYADSDGDSLISPAEFQEAPWDFEDEDVQDE